MIAVGAMIARIASVINVLAGRIEGAAEFAALMKSNALPQVTPAAFVLPLGLQGGQADAAAGAYTQALERVFGVVLVMRNAGRTGEDALDPLDALIEQTVTALAGWGPADAPGVFRLVRGALVSMAAGTVVYQLDFSISDQVRILP